MPGGLQVRRARSGAGRRLPKRRLGEPPPVPLHLLEEHETELEHARTARRHNPSQRRAFTFEAGALASLGRTDELRALLDEAKTYANDFSAGFVIREAGLELLAHGQPELGGELIAESVSWY